MKKINCFEGLRTIGCVGVFLCHFKLAFLPDWSIWLLDATPLKAVVAGNPIVRILLVLSGFVVSYKYFTAKKYDDVPKDIVKRYFRLAPVIIAANILAYVLMKLGLMFNVQAAGVSGSEDFLGIYNTFTPTLSHCLREAFATCYLKGANGYIAPLWMMNFEYLGAILVLCVIYVSKEKALLRYLFYFVMFAFFSSYYNYLVLGMLLCEIYVEQDILMKKLQEHKWINDIVFLTGLCIVCMLNVNDEIKLTRVIFAVGMCMMFIGLLNASWGEKVLGNKAMQKGGKLSYAIYVVHFPIIESFSSAYYLWLTEMNVSGYVVIPLCLIVSFLVILLVAYLFSKYVEQMGRGAIEFIVDKF